MTAVARALHRQNGWLRNNIELEAQHIASLSAGKLRTRMAAYNAALLAAVDGNTEVLHTLYGPPPSWSWPSLPWERTDRNVEIYNGLGSVWRHLAKDWSAEGHGGMRALNERLTSMVVDELRSSPSGSVLLPGCGTGRLAWEVACALPEASVLGTEVSEAQLAVARYMLGCTQVRALTVRPWLDESGNNATEQSRLAALQVPDVAPGGAPPKLELHLVPAAAARLVPASAARQQVDVVCTCFFLDCLKDTLAGVRAVRDALRPGGLWIFAGPLEYHSWPGLCPTLNQLVELAAEEGLEPLAAPQLVAAPYLGKPDALLHKQQWQAAVFACRKV